MNIVHIGSFTPVSFAFTRMLVDAWRVAGPTQRTWMALHLHPGRPCETGRFLALRSVVRPASPHSITLTGVTSFTLSVCAVHRSPLLLLPRAHCSHPPAQAAVQRLFKPRGGLWCISGQNETVSCRRRRSIELLRHPLRALPLLVTRLLACLHPVRPSAATPRLAAG